MTRVKSNTSFAPKVTTMTKLAGQTQSVDMDEPVAYMQEIYALNRDYSSRRRYQVLAVVRLDHLFGFWTDLGPESDFENEIEGETYRQPAYQQPILFEHDVGECLSMAELGRNDEYASRHLHELTMGSNIHDRYIQTIEQDMHLIANRSFFTATGDFKIERNGYSPYAKRLQQERLAETNGHR